MPQIGNTHATLNLCEQTSLLCATCFLSPQKYLKSVDDLLGELEGKRVGVFGVCGQPKEEVDLMMTENNLKFKV